MTALLTPDSDTIETVELHTAAQVLPVCSTDANPDRWVDLPQVRIRGRNNPAYDEAKDELAAICGTCPLRTQCLEASLGMNVVGVMAGFDEYDRAAMREEQGLAVPPRIPAPENDDDARLIDQEFTAIRMAREGLTNRQIADALGVSPMTVSRIFADRTQDLPRRRNADLPDAS